MSFSDKYFIVFKALQPRFSVSRPHHYTLPVKSQTIEKYRKISLSCTFYTVTRAICLTSCLIIGTTGDGKMRSIQRPDQYLKLRHDIWHYVRRVPKMDKKDKLPMCLVCVIVVQCFIVKKSLLILRSTIANC